MTTITVAIAAAIQTTPITPDNYALDDSDSCSPHCAVNMLMTRVAADTVATMVTLLVSPLGVATNGAAVRVGAGSYRSIL